jgi:hypothetical protein
MFAAAPAPFVFAAMLVGLIGLNVAFLAFLVQIGRDKVILFGLPGERSVRLAHLPIFTAAAYLGFLLLHLLVLAWREVETPARDFDTVTASFELFAAAALLASLATALAWVFRHVREGLRDPARIT